MIINSIKILIILSSCSFFIHNLQAARKCSAHASNRFDQSLDESYDKYDSAKIEKFRGADFFRK